MKMRLVIFVLALLLLPPLALVMAAQELSAAEISNGGSTLSVWISGLALLAFGYLLDTYSFRQTGSSLLRTQALYLFWLSAGGAMLGGLFVYLNVFTPLWLSAIAPVAELLPAAFLGGILLPVVLITRLWLSGFSGLLRRFTRILALPAAPPEAVASLLIFLSLVGLLGGAIWPRYLAELFWLAPLTFLSALQLLWHESTVFSGVKNGDWSRVVLGVLAGMITLGIVLLVCEVAGGGVQYAVSNELLFFLCGAYGLLSLQLGDVIAEAWRGKKRAEVYKKKPFPIPVIVKKD